MKPLVSVCIANYNGEKIIDACIASVKQQTGDIEIEIIVHDDASDDASLDVIHRCHPDIALIESSDNVGFCVSNNRMAEQARGDFLLLLNNDATLLPDALQVLREKAQKVRNPAILTLPQYDAESNELIDRGCFLDPFFNPIPNLDTEAAETAMVIGACLWIPRTLWHELDGFPPWFESIGEDLLICCRARLLGHRVLVCDRSGYRHEVGQSFGGGKTVASKLRTSYRRRALSERNKTSSMIICQPGPLLVALLPLHLFLLILEGLVVSLMRRDARIWRRIYAPLIPGLWEHRANLIALRRITQNQRCIGLKEWIKPMRWIPWKLRMLIRHGLPQLR